MYRRYASLFFVTGIGQSDNELITLEIIHRYALSGTYNGSARPDLERGLVTVMSKYWIDISEM